MVRQRGMVQTRHRHVIQQHPHRTSQPVQGATLQSRFIHALTHTSLSVTYAKCTVRWKLRPSFTGSEAHELPPVCTPPPTRHTHSQTGRGVSNIFLFLLLFSVPERPRNQNISPSHALWLKGGHFTAGRENRLLHGIIPLFIYLFLSSCIWRAAWMGLCPAFKGKDVNTAEQ